MKEINIEKAFSLTKPVFIDVRSPGEFAESHIPGAINVPLFSNEERAHVGTTFKIKGQNPAMWLGMELVSGKIPSLMSSIKKEVEEGREPVIYCWRGGMRSKSVASFAEMSGINAHRLTGGFRHYRQWVLEQLNESLLPERFVVLHGMTGVGKTTILHKLKEKGFPILDLEACAGHRGSVFGGIGTTVHNQKTFEHLLFHSLVKLKGLPYVFMEAESKRIGKAIQPDFLLEAKRKGVHILLETTVEHRAERTFQDYVEPYQEDPDFQQKVFEALSPILKRFTPEQKQQILAFTENKQYKTLILYLFTHYYDPRYNHKLEEYEGTIHQINVDDLDGGTNDIIELLKHQEIQKSSAING